MSGTQQMQNQNKPSILFTSYPKTKMRRERGSENRKLCGPMGKLCFSVPQFPQM